MCGTGGVEPCRNWTYAKPWPWGNQTLSTNHIGTVSTDWTSPPAKILQESLLFNCFASYQLSLPKNVNGFELFIPKDKENTLFYMSNTFLEVFIEVETRWQWQLHYERYYRNHCFSIVWQASNEHCLKIFMNFNWPYQNWGKTLYFIFQMISWKLF